MMFRFAYPVLLVLLSGVVGYLAFELLKKPVAITHSMTARLVELGTKGSALWQRIPLVLRALCLILLVLTAARPQFYNISREVRSPGVDIVMCLDTSGSMQALDFQLRGEPVTRLTAVKKVVSEFIRKREVDRIGLVVFGEAAFTQAARVGRDTPYFLFAFTRPPRPQAFTNATTRCFFFAVYFLFAITPPLNNVYLIPSVLQMYIPVPTPGSPGYRLYHIPFPPRPPPLHKKNRIRPIASLRPAGRLVRYHAVR